MLLRARAPLRISFSGGGTDIEPYSREHGGVVLSTTIDRYAYGTLTPRGDGEVRIHSLDLDTREVFDVRAYDDILPQGKLGLVKAVVRRLAPGKGFDLFLHSDAPPGTGMGSSGAMAALVAGLLREYLDLPMTDYELAETAYAIEHDDMGLNVGRQDQYAAVFGGFNLIEFRAGATIVTPLRVKPDIRKELRYHLLLVYTRIRHKSTDLVGKQIEYYRRGREETLAAMDDLKSLTYEMKDALLTGKLTRFAQLLYESGQAKKRMNPDTMTPELDDMYETALSRGAVGGKVLGAGGGGYLILYCRYDRKHEVARALAERFDCEVTDFDFEDGGLDVWRAHEEE